MGVYWNRYNWKALMTRGGKIYYLGSFSTKLEAEDWVRKAEKAYDEEGVILKREKQLKSGVKGIYWHKHREAWEVKWKGKYIGLFKDLKEAKVELDRYKESLSTEGNTSHT